MFAVRILIDLPFARLSSLSRPESLDLALFTNPWEMRLFTSSSAIIQTSISRMKLAHRLKHLYVPEQAPFRDWLPIAATLLWIPRC